MNCATTNSVSRKMNTKSSWLMASTNPGQ